jgi:hypothetical protein
MVNFALLRELPLHWQFSFVNVFVDAVAFVIVAVGIAVAAVYSRC